MMLKYTLGSFYALMMTVNDNPPRVPRRSKTDGAGQENPVSAKSKETENVERKDNLNSGNNFCCAPKAFNMKVRRGPWHERVDKPT